MRALEWTGKTLRLLNQTKLPAAEEWTECKTADDVADAIVTMKVRGAPAIGASAAYGVALEALRLATGHAGNFGHEIEQTLDKLANTRPTAVNLFWAIERMRKALHTASAANRDATQLALYLVREAEAIAAEDIVTNQAIGRYGAECMHGSFNILTHCNTGSLATVEYGTALGVIRSIHAQGRLKHVWVDETRPFLQGARLTAFELTHDNIPHTLITDNMAAHFMKSGEVDAVVVGADRIAANGDTANKIGTYGLAVLCAYHHLPFYVAAPTTTFDLTLASGDEIPIEQRSAQEVTHVLGTSIAPATTTAAHPAFDVTPHPLITGIITEKGVISRPDRARVHAVVGAELPKQKGKL